MTPRTSIRTLVLLLELLAAVVALQYLATAQPARADAIWLAGNTRALVQPCAEPYCDVTTP